MRSPAATRTDALWSPAKKKVAGSKPAGPRFRLRFPGAPIRALRSSWRYFIPPVVIASIAVVAIAAYNLSVFQIAQVSVRGVVTLSPKQIVDATRLEGRRLFDVSDRAVAESLGGFSRVKQIEVVRKPPNEIEIVVEERRPWAVWQAGSGNWLIDDEGVVLDPAPVSTTLPVLIYAGSGAISAGTRVRPDPVQLALQLDRALPQAVRAKAKRFEYSENGGLLVVSDQGWQARFGSSEDLEYKLATLKAVIDAARARNVKFSAVDLRFGTRPFIR